MRPKLAFSCGEDAPLGASEPRGNTPLPIWGNSPILAVMERFISDVEAYALACGITPQALLRNVINAQWGQWQKWKAGEASPTMRIADRIYAHMAENPAQQTSEDAA